MLQVLAVFLFVLNPVFAFVFHTFFLSTIYIYQPSATLLPLLAYFFSSLYFAYCQANEITLSMPICIAVFDAVTSHTIWFAAVMTGTNIQCYRTLIQTSPSLAIVRLPLQQIRRRNGPFVIDDCGCSLNRSYRSIHHLFS